MQCFFLFCYQYDRYIIAVICYITYHIQIITYEGENKSSKKN